MNFSLVCCRSLRELQRFPQLACVRISNTLSFMQGVIISYLSLNKMFLKLVMVVLLSLSPLLTQVKSQKELYV